MKHDRASLKSITNKDYRAKVSDLLDNGWSAERTGNNHFKLSHPDAGRSVIASGTPSDFRASANLEMQCRRALRLGQHQTDHVEREEQRQDLLDDLRNPPGSGKKRRKNKKRWTARDRTVREHRKLTAPPLSEPQVQTPPTTLLPLKCEKPNLDMTPEKMQMLLMNAEPLDDVVGSSTPPSITPPTGPIAPEEPVSGTVVASGELTTIPTDILAIAIRIMSGDMRTVPITADMVGKTLVLEGDCWMVDGQIGKMTAPAVAASPAVNTPAGRTAAPASDEEQAPCPAQCDDALSLRMLEVFRAFRGEFMGTSQVMDLVDNDAGSSIVAHREAIRYRLKNMMNAGLLIRKNGGHGKRKAFVYSLAA